MFKSYSQLIDGHRIDVHLFENYINIKNCQGIFLELGACNGIYLSNTKALEDYLNFTGILIEPGINDYNQLIHNRPNCKNYNCAIDEKEGFFEYIGDGTGVGGLINNLSETWIKAWKLNKNNIQKVQTRKLCDILHENKIKYIDFWSLDVEGSELNVLKTMDWSIPVYIIVLEVSAWGEKGQQDVEKCRNILRKQNFTCDGKRYGLDEWWINENYFRKKYLKNNK